MNREKMRIRRLGFSLIEMMVVMGILAILIAALLPFLGGSTDSADCVKCKNNMKALAMAMISCAQSDDENGHFPAAGYYRSLTVDYNSDDRNKRRYYPHPSWISNKGNYSDLKRTLKEVYMGSVAHIADNEEDCREVVENGAIWGATGASLGVYRCPTHTREFDKKFKRPPGWSYMMNKTFGYDRADGKATGFCGKSIHNSINGRGHDKVLMFAEIQGIDVNDSKNNVSLKAVTSGDGADAVLEYGENYDVMGFNHKLGKKQYGGNVAFTDGHVETFVLPKSMKLKELTQDLCQGIDVPRDGSYEPNRVDK